MTARALFSPLKVRDVVFRNRIGVSPMCQYSCPNADGLANDWHLVHLGSRAAGGAGVVVVEATGVEPRGRISPNDLGIWSDDHVAPLARITSFLKEHGAVPAIQLAHAGRKASVSRPWEGDSTLSNEQGGWTSIAPSPIAFGGSVTKVPKEMTLQDIAELKNHFVEATRRALKAGFELVELHAAHGYLLHEFYSPLSNKRTDQYGGSFENRVRLVLEVAKSMREAWPSHLPFAVRLSCSDWVEGGWTIDDTVALCKRLHAEAGVDIVDCSSGFNSTEYKRIPFGPNFQVPFAERLRKEVPGLLTAAVGLITNAEQADAIVREEKADLVFLAREFLRDPYFPYHAAVALGVPNPHNILPTSTAFWIRPKH